MNDDFEPKPQILQSEEEQRKEELRPGFLLLHQVLNEATNGLGVVVRNVYYSICSNGFHADIRYKWLSRKPNFKICHISMYNRGNDIFIYVNSTPKNYIQPPIDINNPSTKEQIDKVRQQIRNLIYTYDIKGR